MAVSLATVADGGGVSALDLNHPASIPAAPAGAVPPQAAPALTVSLTQGCELPLDALKCVRCHVSCHPYDEAVVRLLVGRVRRTELQLLICPSVRPGTLRLY